MKRPERGPIPIAKTQVELNTEVDILNRRVGELSASAATVGDLGEAGLVTQTSDGTIVATTKAVGGPQGLYDFLKGF